MEGNLPETNHTADARLPMSEQLTNGFIKGKGGRHIEPNPVEFL